MEGYEGKESNHERSVIPHARPNKPDKEQVDSEHDPT
jgi:hypothetical protein